MGPVLRGQETGYIERDFINERGHFENLGVHWKITLIQIL